MAKKLTFEELVAALHEALKGDTACVEEIESLMNS